MQYCKLPKIVHYSTEEVSSFAKINKLFTPTGCAKTLKAKTDHIEAEIAETQKHQKEFDFQIKKEYEKLFSPLNLNIKSQLFRKYSKKLPKLKISPIFYKKTFEKRQKSDDSKKMNGQITSFEFTPNLKNYKKLPALAKSTRAKLNLKPWFSKEKQKFVEKKELERLDSVESLLDDLKIFNDSDKKNLEKGVKSFLSKASDINDYIDDLIDSVKFSKNEEVLENMIYTRKYNKKLNKKLRIESETIKNL